MPSTTPSVSPDPLDQAVAIAESLVADAIDLEDGKLGWVEAVPQGRTGRLQAVLAPPGIYHGGEGIAVFFASLAAATGQERWAALARRALPATPDPAETSIMLTSGWTGWAWAASVVAEQLGDQELAATAADLFGHPASIPVLDPTDSLDLIGGWSGPLAAACSVARRTGNPETIDSSVEFGHALADVASTQLDDETRVRPLTRMGMAHGSLGVTLALGAASELGDDPLTAQVFKRMVALEDDRIARRDHVGARIDQGKRRVPSRTWCWGVAGYLMATAQPWFATHDRSLSENASFAVLASGDSPLDHACCGSAGRLEAAVTAQHSLGIADAGELVEGLVDHLARPALHFHPASAFDSPGLFRGRAGVGQALLRAQDPTLPSALALT